ncbi:MraY family glycosyltransferase [Fodinibius sp. AD559]|uniref:MraY family glycosyltransferase n=1 Tax=Fodinibius sp. AD559 TaxID=3424179 RepID=UPI0040468BC7
MDALIILKETLPILAAIGAFIITYWLIPSIIDVSHLKGLFDDPADERKLHVTAIPNLGGVAIFATVFIVFSISGYATQYWAPYLAAGLTLLFFSGIKDDILVIDPYKKLLIQVMAVLALMVGGELVITNLGGVFGLYEIPYEAGFGLTFFTMIVVLNAYNLIDGIDGLAGGVGVIASLFFGWWFWETGMMAHSVFAFIMAGSLLAFLRFNFQPASIFMGDTGSQVVGYSLAFLAVAFVQAGVTSPVEVPYQNAVPVIVLSVLIVPLFDTLRVFLFRVLRGKSPFKADRRHVHHQLIDMGFSHRAACYILYAYTVGITGMTFALSWMEVNTLLAVVLGITVLLFPTVRIKRRLLKKLGINMPSRRQIQILEMKYGMPPKTVGRKVDQKEAEEGKDEMKEVVA